jgi:hypothetical protein
MLRMIRAYQAETGFKVGFKPAGGISAAKDVLNYQILMKEELGRECSSPISSASALPRCSPISSASSNIMSRAGIRPSTAMRPDKE